MIVTTGIDSLLDTMLNTRQPTDPQLSPDGQCVAFVLGETARLSQKSPLEAGSEIAAIRATCPG